MSHNASNLNPDDVEEESERTGATGAVASRPEIEEGQSDVEASDSRVGKPAAQPAALKRRRRAKPKPEGMPRRPLSAYNYFFRDERARLLAQREAGVDEIGEDAALRSQAGLRSSNIFFGSLGKTIAKHWKDVSPAALERYKRMAEEDMARYRREMALYQQERGREQERASSGHHRERNVAVTDKAAPSSHESSSTEEMKIASVARTDARRQTTGLFQSSESQATRPSEAIRAYQAAAQQRFSSQAVLPELPLGTSATLFAALAPLPSRFSLTGDPQLGRSASLASQASNIDQTDVPHLSDPIRVAMQAQALRLQMALEQQRVIASNEQLQLALLLQRQQQQQRQDVAHVALRTSLAASQIPFLSALEIQAAAQFAIAQQQAQSLLGLQDRLSVGIRSGSALQAVAAEPASLTVHDMLVEQRRQEDLIRLLLSPSRSFQPGETKDTDAPSPQESRQNP